MVCGEGCLRDKKLNGGGEFDEGGEGHECNS